MNDTMAMDYDVRCLINAVQSDFPIVAHPFAQVAARLKWEEAAVMTHLENLLQAGLLTRFGPLFNAEAMGGGVTLAAMALPDDLFDGVADIVNRFPAVAHNYARDHTLNMWFVVATETREEIAETLADIESQTGHPVFNMPKLREYCLGFQMHVSESGVDTVPLCATPASPAGPISQRPPDSLDRAIITATQDGLPCVSAPYHAVADVCGVAPDRVLTRMRAMLVKGWIRRIGAVPNHYRLGLKGNGMTVWQLPEDKIDTYGQKVGALGFVSHCYRRPPHRPDWPFNLFAMVHGRDKQAVTEKVATIQSVLQPDLQDHTVLFSTRILKKSGLRFKHATTGV